MRLLYNLSFDGDARETMMKNSLLPKLVELLKQAPFRALTLRVLYHLSIEERCKSMFSYTEGIPILRQLVVRYYHFISLKLFFVLKIYRFFSLKNLLLVNL